MIIIIIITIIIIREITIQKKMYKKRYVTVIK